MKHVAVGVLCLGLLAAPAAFADAKSGGDVFATRCNMCHGAGVGGAPPTDKLKASPPETIVEKLTNGTMAPMAAGLSDADKRDIAVFLSGKGLPASGDLAAVEPLPAGDPAPAAQPAPAVEAAPAAPQ
jgi:polyvinyl alcohol dehydrogenase (cytochrome)